MKSKKAVESTSEITDAYRPGLHAILGRDRKLMSCAQTQKLSGSINLDDAVTALYPNAPRWDYGIGLVVNKQKDRAIWVEVHSASTRNVSEMIKKLGWLKDWLNSSGSKMKRLGETQFYWVTRGTICISPNSRQLRLLKQSGIRGPKKHLNLDKC